MSRHKLRIHRTPVENLVANLRGEVGEIITTWTMMRRLIAQERRLSSGDIAKDMGDEEVAFFAVLVDKLSDELVARLSELAETKVGRLNFHFASVKLNALDAEVLAFRTFIRHHRFAEKRNYDISHKELPERWSEHRLRHISYRLVLRGVALGSSVMKKIDAIVQGPSAKYMWHEMRKRRYSVINPPRAAYMLLPYLKLSDRTRKKIIMEEMVEGREIWSEMATKINGNETKVYACKKWGAILLGGELIILEHYPLQGLSEIKVDPRTQSTTTPISGKPIYKQKNISAKYRVAEVSESEVSLVPTQRLHLLDEAAFTELGDITIRLDEKLRQNMGNMKVGDVKELTMAVTVLAGHSSANEI
jgi:hypothetical protein